MTQSISLTVPMDYNALTRASDMLHGLAVDLNKQTPELQEPAGGMVVQPDGTTFFDEAPVDNGPQFLAHIDGVDVYSDTQITLSQHAQLTAEQQTAHNGRVVANPVETSAEPVTTAPTPEPVQPATTTADPVATATPAAPVQTATVPAGVELDKGGLPWDERIHAGTKTKKADGYWKAKRGVDKELVVQVEAELRAAMAVPTPNVPAEPAPVAASQPATPATPAPVATAPVAPVIDPNVAAAPVVEPVPAANPAGITTLPQLMAAATGAGKKPEEMLAAANSVGLQSMALLGARPDLVPAVAAALGLGG